MTRHSPSLALILVLGTSCSDKGDDSEEPATDSEAAATSTSGTDSDTDTDAQDPEFEGMVFVEAGEFGRGCNSALSTWGCRLFELPATFVTLDAFWIDEDEVSRGEYQACVQAGACTQVDSGCVAEAPQWARDPMPELPAFCVSHLQAREYCAWEGKRLPTEAQWEKAARGTQGQTYPWGSGAPDCLRTQVSGCGDAPVAVGSLESGASPYGALEMTGNVSEWTADRFGPEFYAESPQNNPVGNQFLADRVARGGSYLLDPTEQSLTTWHRDPRPPHGAFDVGFRCARSVEGSVCGNGVVETGEVCDDGNDVAGDGCESDCERSGTVSFLGTSIQTGDVVVPAAAPHFAVVGRGVFEIWTPGVPDPISSAFFACCGVDAAPLDGEVAVVAGDRMVPTTGPVELLRVFVFGADPIGRPAQLATPVWQLTMGTSGLDASTSKIAARPDGTLIVAYHSGQPWTTPAVVLALDPSAPPSDAVLWERSLPLDRLATVASGPNGRFAIGGGAMGTPTTSSLPFVEVFDRDGDSVWRDNFAPDAGFSEGGDVAFDPNGDLFAVVRIPPVQDPMGNVLELGGFALRKYSAQGEELGTDTYIAPPEFAPVRSCDFEGCSTPTTITIGPDGSLYVAGDVGATRSPIVKWNSAGDEVVWVSDPQFQPGVHRSATFGSDGALGWISQTEGNWGDGDTEFGILERL